MSSFFIEKLILATHNAGKVPEIAYYIKTLVGEVKCAGDLGLPEPEETENTFAGNAILKAQTAANASGEICLADDSGICVNALNGQPGILSSRWGGPSKDFKMAGQRIQDELVGKEDRSAYFMCTLALAWPDGKFKTFEGRVNGRIIDGDPRGDKGFGYDPIFIMDDDTRTFGEIGFDEKQEISHRARAMDGLVDYLKLQNG